MPPFHEVQAILAPVRPQTGPLGCNIVRRQPDVEVLCMLLNDTPMTAAAFDGMRKGNDWVSMGVGVIAVGPPGFSSVPYSSSKKPGEKEDEQKRLYSLDDTGRTVFSTFEKMKNNKDRGKRVPTMEVTQPDGETRVVDATAVLEPGVCLSTFMREDVYAGPNPFFVRDEEDTEEVLAAGTLVYLAFGTKNVEQAVKGQLLKFKKMKRCANAAAALSTCYHSLPKEDQGCKEVCQQSVEKYPAMAKQVLASPKNAVVGGLCNASAYVSYNDQTNKIVLTDLCLGKTEPIEVVFETDALLRNHGFSDASRLVRWINIAIARKGVGVAVLCKSSYGDEGDTTSYVGAALNVDLTTVLAMADLFAMNDIKDVHPSMIRSAHIVNDVFVWSPGTDACVGQPESLNLRELVFALRLKKSVLQDPWNEGDASILLTDGCKDPFYALSAYAVERIPGDFDFESAETWEVLARLIAEPQALLKEDVDIPFSKKMILSVQLHPENRGATSNKRKRPDIFVDDPKDNVEEYMDVE